MRLNTIFIFLVLLLILSLLGINVHAAPNEKIAGCQELVQTPEETSNGDPQNQAQEIVLYPFFQLQNKGSKIGIERIIVTLLMSMPSGVVKCDFNNATFRKMFYDLLQSGKSESDIRSQALATLSRQLGFTIDAAVKLSRSFIIVH